MAEELHFDDPAAAAQDPSTDAEALRQLAYRYPELRPAVAAHPHAYRGLLDWLHQFNDPQVNAALEARDDYDGYIDSNGYLVMHGDVSGAVAGSSIRTSESGMYVLGQGGVNSYSQVERTTPYSAVVGTNAPVPQVGAREQVVAQVQRQSIMGSKATQDPEATAVYPSASAGSSYPSASGTPARPQSTPQAYRGAGASYQVQPTASQEVAPKEEKERRGFPMMGLVLGDPGPDRRDPPRLRYLRVHARIRGAGQGNGLDPLGVLLGAGSSDAFPERDHGGARQVPGARRCDHRGLLLVPVRKHHVLLHR